MMCVCSQPSAWIVNCGSGNQARGPGRHGELHDPRAGAEQQSATMISAAQRERQADERPLGAEIAQHRPGDQQRRAARARRPGTDEIARPARNVAGSAVDRHVPQHGAEHHLQVHQDRASPRPAGERGRQRRLRAARRRSASVLRREHDHRHGEREKQRARAAVQHRQRSLVEAARACRRARPERSPSASAARLKLPHPAPLVRPPQRRSADRSSACRRRRQAADGHARRTNPTARRATICHGYRNKL